MVLSSLSPPGSCALGALLMGLLASSALAAAPATFTIPAEAVAHPDLWPKAHSPAALTDARTERRIDALMSAMSLEEKVGQTIQADLTSLRPEDLARYPVGSILAGGNDAPKGDNRGPASDWLDLIRRFDAATARLNARHEPIPLLVGIDAVHGHNKIRGATLFPHNVGLGAARDPDLIRRIGEATAEEAAVTGVNWTFGPTLATPRDIHWGRSYEGYGEEPEIPAAYAGPMTLGLQGELKPGAPIAPDHIVGSAKHFLADGGTLGGKDQGDARLSEQELIRVHDGGYPPALDAGIMTVMASFSSWNGLKNTANSTLLTDVLKGRMGFEGFVVGDWNAHGQLPGCSVGDCPAALNAGLDMYMVPEGWKTLFDNLVEEVRDGRIPMSRLDDAVRRILRVKFKAGLFDRTSSVAGRLDRLGAPEHRALARRAVRESLVLLKNDGSVLPIRGSAHVLVAGDGADNIGKQSGGWTLNWQGAGNANSDFPNGRSIFSGLKEALESAGGSAVLSRDGSWSARPDVAIVVFGEEPYAEFQGDITSLEYQPGDKRDLALIKRLKDQGVPVVAVFLSGRPLWVNPEINAADAFVAAWLPGTEGEGVADVLVADAAGKARHDFRGRLSFSWPKRADRIPGHRGEPGYDPQFAYGYGLDYAHPFELGLLSEDPGARTPPHNVERYFVDGRVRAPFAPETLGAVTVSKVDGDAQENGLNVIWRGKGSFAFSAPPFDLTRQATGELAVQFRYRVEVAPKTPVSMALACGDQCEATVDVTRLFAAARPGEWRTDQITLNCFGKRGLDFAKVTAPFGLAASGPFSITFTEVRLAPNEGQAICPR